MLLGWHKLASCLVLSSAMKRLNMKEVIDASTPTTGDWTALEKREARSAVSISLVAPFPRGRGVMCDARVFALGDRIGGIDRTK